MSAIVYQANWNQGIGNAKQKLAEWDKQQVLQQNSALMAGERNAAWGFVSRGMLLALLTRGIADTE